MFSTIFINRPRLAMVLSLVMLLAGALSINTLPVEEYPNITPPQMYIVCTYTGASAEVIRDTVAFPIEDEINGVDDLQYFSSDCDATGTYMCMVTFKSGTDPDMALVNVQNAVKRAEPRLPTEVTRIGIQIMARSNDILCVYAFSTDGSGMSQMELSNYVSKSVKDYIQRAEGVTSVSVMGAKNYSMRVWLDPMRMNALGVSTAEIIAAIQGQNLQAASGTLGNEGGNQYLQMKIDVTGRLKTVDEFGDIIVRTAADGSMIHLKDVTNIELGAQDYANSAKYNGNQAFAVMIYRDSESNAMRTMANIRKVMDDLKPRLAEGVTFNLAYDPTAFIGVSMREIVITLFVALILVIAITYLFLQDWRATVIPSLAIPVSLMATFPVMKAMGFSINVLTMFGLILVIGSLVDDAIVVVEGTMALIEREKLSPKKAAIKCMSQITGAIIATTLVTVACYMPLAFYGGIVGTIYMQFAVTMCIALCFSTLVAMTLSPALCALILRPAAGARRRLFAPFNYVLDNSRKFYLKLVGFLVRRSLLTLAILAAVFGGIYLVSRTINSSFLPEEDKGVVMCNIDLPPGATLERTDAAVEELRAKVMAIPGVEATLSIAGFSFLSGAGENSGMLIVDLKHWDERKAKNLEAHAIMQQIQGIAMASDDARIMCFTPPAIQGLGATGGVSMNLCGEGDISSEELEQVANGFALNIMQLPETLYAMSRFSANSPQLFLDIDRPKAIAMGLSIQEIFTALQAQIGSYYVNDFTLQGESFYVQIQTGKGERGTEDDLMRIQIPCAKTGAVVPLSAIASIKHTVGPRTMSRFNKMTSSAITVQGKPGVPSVTLMDKIKGIELPKNYHIEWTDLSFHENQNRGRIGPLMALAVLFAFLFLVGQYESWSIPVPVMLTVATATLGALIGLKIAGQTLSIYAQLGLVMLIGLTAKNAILMVEFSKQERDHGVPISEAAMNGANLRYRAVLMTAWSFLFGVFPLVVATGAGAGSRVAIGVPTFSGMVMATLIGIILTPALYAVFQRLREGIKHLIHMKTAAEKYAEEQGEEAGNAGKSGSASSALVALVAAVSLIALSTGCATVRDARNAQRDESRLAGERVVSLEELGIDAERMSVSLDQLESVALIANPAVMQAHQAVVLAQLAVKDIKSSYIPVVDANAGYTLVGTDANTPDGSFDTTDAFVFGGSLNWLVYDFGSTKAATRQAVSALIAAERASRATEDSVVYGVRSAAFALNRAIELQDVAAESASLYAEHLKQMKDRFEVGAVNSYAVSKANVDYCDAVLSAVTASNAVAIARAALNSSLGLAEPAALRLEKPAVKAYDHMTLDDLMAFARTNAPTLASLQASADGARYYVDKTIADLYPSLGVSISYLGTIDEGELLSQLTGAASLTQSIFSAGRNKRAIKAAVAQLRIARSKVAAEELSLYSELTQATLNATRAKEQLQVAKEKLRTAQENYDIVSERYEVGKASELERNDAQVALMSSQASMVSAEYDYYDSQIKIAKLIGD